MTVKKFDKSNPVAKAMQNKRFHQKIKLSKKGFYKRTNNKQAIHDSVQEREDEYQEFLEHYHDVMDDTCADF